MNQLLNKLDLTPTITRFNSYLAREKPLFLEGDSGLHFRYIQKIAKIDFTAPPPLIDLERALSYLRRSGTIKLDEIFAFVKIIQYFIYLKKLGFDEEIRQWLGKIIIPDQVMNIVRYFDEKGNLLERVDERFVAINQGLKRSKEQNKAQLQKLLRSPKLSDYLVDTQIHYVDESETLLLRGGFNQVLRGSVLARSSTGFFYVLPEAISQNKRREAELLSQKEALVYEYEKKISSIFTKFEKFLSFINREFDRFDHYQARINFAKDCDLEFVKPSKGERIKLERFAHPALSDPKPISLDFDKKILMITGVNAGGKTMLLKAILSAVFLSKYLLPLRIDATHSQIGSFKSIEAIIDDPQSVKNDISTFAGRMQEFSKLFCKDHFIAGVDEIELGTDSDEAASLFRVILEKLSTKHAKIIITTHHKRLASMMALHPQVELLAAIYDEESQRPTYQFLQGTIGKSYAFETAQRYGIPATIVQKARALHGEDKEKLNDLIQKNIDLELSLKTKLDQIHKEESEIATLKEQLKNQKHQQNQLLKAKQTELEHAYKEAITTAKSAAKTHTEQDRHRTLNRADKLLKQARSKRPTPPKPEHLEVGDYVRYQNTKGKILSIKKKEAFIDSNGIKLRVALSDLQKVATPPKPKKRAKISVQKPAQASVELDLHGLRSDEAIEKLDRYLSDALITGYDEVLIYHGIGTGKLAYAVKTFLKTHPKIKSFSDAPANMGGMGATLVKL